MNKWFIKILLTVFMISTLITPTGYASAENTNSSLPTDEITSLQTDKDNIELEDENRPFESSKIEDGTSYNVDVEEEFGIHNENFEMAVTESSQQMSVVSQLQTKQTEMSSEFFVDLETGEMYVTESIIDEENNTRNKIYDFIFSEIDGEEFKATLIDRESKETYEINTIDAKASAIPVLAIVVQMGARWAIKKYGQRALISAFGKYALSNAIKNVAKLTVKSKHLKSNTGKWAKFNTNSQSTAKSWIKEAMQKVSVSNFEINNNEKLSFRFDVGMGKKVGTKGETKIRVIIGYDGKIWSAFPVK